MSSFNIREGSGRPLLFSFASVATCLTRSVGPPRNCEAEVMMGATSCCSTIGFTGGWGSSASSSPKDATDWDFLAGKGPEPSRSLGASWRTLYSVAGFKGRQSERKSSKIEASKQHGKLNNEKGCLSDSPKHNKHTNAIPFPLVVTRPGGWC